MGLFRRRASETPAEPDQAETEAPADEESRGGPWDAADAPDNPARIDLGGLQVPAGEGTELQLEVDKATGAVTTAKIVLGDSTLQLHAFAAPRSSGLWEEVRDVLRDSIKAQGGTVETRDGAFGRELLCRLPIRRADGRQSYQPARFIGVDGPRWFLRAIVSGPAVHDAERSAQIEEILRDTVVVRGTEAMAPQEQIALTMPGGRAMLPGTDEGPLDPLARGPEITQIG